MFYINYIFCHPTIIFPTTDFFLLHIVTFLYGSISSATSKRQVSLTGFAVFSDGGTSSLLFWSPTDKVEVWGREATLISTALFNRSDVYSIH